MNEILKEIQELKIQQIALSNLMIEQGKQNEMVLTVLKNLLSELIEEQEKSKEEEVLEGILEKLEILIEKLD